MNALTALLAELEQNDKLLLLKSVGSSSSSWSQTGIIFAILGVVALIPFILVYLFRKRLLGRRKRRHREHRPAPTAVAAAENPETEGGKVRKKWRRSRHQHRHLNPTLAQTRGLPPLREEGTPPPPAL